MSISLTAARAIGVGGILLPILFLALFPAATLAQEANGTIRGIVVSAETKEPVTGATVAIPDTKRGAISNRNGEFTIDKLTPGGYSLKVTSLGHQPVVKTDIIVRPDRITQVTIELPEKSTVGQEVTVTAGYFSGREESAISAVAMNAEEIRRAPGSAGDISRVLNALPSVARTADNRNDLAVRGGSPVETSFSIDNIPIPNVNYFPQQGSSGGPIGFLNVDFIDGVEFQAGGFGAEYGDRLSSVVNINYRDGNREELEGQIDLNMAGFGGAIEGPLPGSVGSFMLSGHRSYLDLIQSGSNYDGAPRFGDLQGKATVDLDQNNRVTLLGIAALSQFNRTYEEAQDNGNSYGEQQALQTTAGGNWRSIWSGVGFSNTSLSFSSTDADEEFFRFSNRQLTYRNNYVESAITLRNLNTVEIADNQTLEFGIEAAREIMNYDVYMGPDTNSVGEVTSALEFMKEFTTAKGGAYVSHSWTPTEALTTSVGMRAEYFSVNGDLTVSPRASVVYRATDQLRLKGAFGIYHQTLPMALLAQDPRNESLPSVQSTHYVLGADYMLTDDTKLTVEGYVKQYRDLPLNPQRPMVSIIDEASGDNHFGNYGELLANGEGRSHGVELLLQKKLAEDFYGLVSASYIRSSYRDANGEWRDRMFDNKYLFSVVGGWRPNNLWEVSVRFNMAGGTPYTPLDLTESARQNRTVRDNSKFMAERYPDYHTLNVRVDRRFLFDRSNLVIYLSVLNAYNRDNVADYYWNRVKKEQRAQLQLGLIPILGVEWEL
ncbi:MAG: TonB-dependent receptor [Chlorobi bacterium CHB2]|nr:TonB-dependent receptor [Chlorobi bacterium CHB2]